MKTPIPTNIITGLLGAGKTTTILELLAQHSDNEQWAVVINEFGRVDIDAAWLRGHTQQKSFIIKEVKGGCICCSAGMTMQVTLTRLLREITPSRLLIEPTGVAQPSSLLKILQNQWLAQAVALKAVICLVDPRQFNSDLLEKSTVYRGQLNCADVVVLNKSDLATPSELGKLTTFLNTLPTQPHILQTQFGKFARSWLDVPHASSTSAQYLEKSLLLPIFPSESFDEITIPSSKIQRFETQQNNRKTCGWIFPENYQFTAESLLKFFNNLKQLPIERAKGIFRISATQSQLFNQVAENLTITRIEHRADSRIELISFENAMLDWEQLEQIFMTHCVQSAGTHLSTTPNNSVSPA